MISSRPSSARQTPLPTPTVSSARPNDLERERSTEVIPEDQKQEEEDQFEEDQALPTPAVIQNLSSTGSKSASSSTGNRDGPVMHTSKRLKNDPTLAHDSSAPASLSFSSRSVSPSMAMHSASMPSQPTRRATSPKKKMRIDDGPGSPKKDD